MKPNADYTSQSNEFWANVRLVSQQVGYTVRGKGQIKTPSISEIKTALEKVDLDYRHIVDAKGVCTEFGKLLKEYFDFRATVLNEFVEPLLMDVGDVKQVFDDLYARLNPTCPIPLNKQKGEKSPSLPYRNNQHDCRGERRGSSLRL